VPSTFHRLRLCRALNRLDWLTPLQLALGAADGELEISYDPSFGGSASVYGQRWPTHVLTERVPARRLDTLVEEGAAPLPDLIKIDVEGHELAVLQGAQAAIEQAQPAIVFELNEPLAQLAGWTLEELAMLLASLGDYRYFVIRPQALEEIDPARYRADEDRYAVDILARPTSR
jgi:FkbM family methyltransferase